MRSSGGGGGADQKSGNGMKLEDFALCGFPTFYWWGTVGCGADDGNLSN